MNDKPREFRENGRRTPVDRRRRPPIFAFRPPPGGVK
jgi:hypothetical protein